ncbi:hypothetical protein DSL72_005406 [Monilinia vaccinii-corymbosi]|uniref:Uncharacterized protein n=1 Tax=Monilinia vaccinii-corymbosi TaxID=61207 RepID=A0A8A3PFL3_9HELO|nr:hypothetical protein DSL72_005406 [Monilinia vaccinii-corymbosi]
MTLYPLQFNLINTTTPDLSATTPVEFNIIFSLESTGNFQQASKMCIHKRIIFIQCGHAIWGNEVKACDQEIAFQTSPRTSVECETMSSHPIHTVKITRACKVCEKKRGHTARTAEKLKQALKIIRESVERMEQMQARVIENSKEISVDADDEDLAALESWD